MEIFIGISIISALVYIFLFMYFKIKGKYFLNIDIEHPCIVLCFIVLLFPFCNFIIFITLILTGLYILLSKGIKVLLCRVLP